MGGLGGAYHHVDPFRVGLLSRFQLSECVTMRDLTMFQHTISPSFFVGGWFFLHTGMFCLRSSCCFDRFFSFLQDPQVSVADVLAFLHSVREGGMFEGICCHGYLEKSLCHRDSKEVSLILVAFFI